MQEKLIGKIIIEIFSVQIILLHLVRILLMHIKALLMELPKKLKTKLLTEELQEEELNIIKVDMLLITQVSSMKIMN